MRGTDETSGALFGYIDPEERSSARHPPRKVRRIVNHVLATLDAEFEALHGKMVGPPSRRSA